MPRKTTPKLGEALDQYLRSRATHCAKNTVANDRAVLRKFVREVGDPQVHLLDPFTVESWFAAEAERQQASSYNKIRTRVQNFVGFLNRRGWLAHDVMGEIRPRRVQKKERLRLSTDQLRRLIETCPNPRDRGMLAVAANTGLRASDLTALMIGDVLLDQGLIRVEVQKTGDLDYLPITSDLDTELRDWLAWYAERLSIIGQALEPGFVMFPALGHCNVRRNGVMERYGDPLPARKLSHPARVVQRALERVGVQVTKDQGFHTLRSHVEVAVQGHQATTGSRREARRP